MLVRKWVLIDLLPVPMQELLRIGDTDRKSCLVYLPMLLRSGHSWYEVFHVTDEDNKSVEKTSMPRCCDMSMTCQALV